MKDLYQGIASCQFYNAIMKHYLGPVIYLFIYFHLQPKIKKGKIG